MREKLITFTVPCYNSADYMERCVDSLLLAGDAAEIIIVNDGSTDGTAAIAQDYEMRYPNIVRAIHKENGGHGSAVNAGIEHANGTYFKVVDSDDWLDQKAIKTLMQQLDLWDWQNEKADLVVCNYIYDHLYENKQKVMKYANVFPQGEFCNWNEIHKFHPSQYLVMHALIFRTEILRKADVKLPLHTFYVDNLFSYQPLPYVEKIYYMDLDLYHYFLGREDPSVTERVLMARIDQQIRVTKLVSECVDLDQVRVKYPKLAEYMTRNISIMMAISSIHLILIGDREAMEKRRALWEEIHEKKPALYRKLKFGTLSGFTYLPGRAGAFFTQTGYRMAKKIYQFQ